jgi:integrase
MHRLRLRPVCVSRLQRQEIALRCAWTSTPSLSGWRSSASGRWVYDLRHTFATFALRAGISTFDLSRYMGASLTMIDRHYGHLARDGREHAIRLLDELSAGERPRWTLVDAAWTPSSAAAVSEDNGNSS